MYYITVYNDWHNKTYVYFFKTEKKMLEIVDLINNLPRSQIDGCITNKVIAYGLVVADDFKELHERFS
jgi:hypothetical protein